MKTEGSIEGKTLRFSFTDGPMKGKRFDHVFAGDTVKWGAPDTDKKTQSKAALSRIGDGVYVGSYVTDEGNTLTSAMNLNSGKLVSFASDGKQWSQHNGTVEIVS